MSTPFVGEMRWFSFDFAPKGWAACNGQLMPIGQNQALFSLLGTTYGGDGRTTFALPGMQGRASMHAGGGLAPGQSGGERDHTLTLAEAPAHAHAGRAVSAPGTLPVPAGNYWAGSTVGDAMYATSAPDATMLGGTVGPGGGGQPHPNMQPFLALNLSIALQGIFPSRN